MNLRRATLADIDVIFNLLNELYDHKVKREIFVKLFTEKIKDSNNYYVVAEEDNVVIAVLIMEIRQKLTRAKSEAYIESIIVDKRHRNKGIGKTLLNNAIEYAKEIDCEVVDLTCTISNEKGQKFYEDTGFIKHSYKYRQYMNTYLKNNTHTKE